MSLSTVSITANPAAATRRRPVVADKSRSSNIDLLTPEPPQQNGGVAENDRALAGGSRDLSHHSIHDRSARDPVTVKRTGGAAANSTVSPRRGKKGASKQEKPRWATVLSVFLKNFVLLLVLIGVAQVVRKLVEKSGEERSIRVGPGFDLSELDGKFAEVESLVKTTASMMQLQVEVVESKIEKEVGGLKSEMKRIEEKGEVLESGLMQLAENSEGLERDVKELSSGNLVSKQELERLYEDLKNGKWNVGGSDVSLDEIRAYARGVVEREIAKHAADGLGMVDYALASAGAMVVKHSETYLASGKRANWFSKSNIGGVHHNANKMLTPSFGEPGQCFPLKGSAGFVEIRLRVAIIPEAITLEHVAKSVAYDRSSAPKDCRVSGWLQGEDTELGVDAAKRFLLTEFTYDLEKTNAQTYYVVDSPASGLIDTVRLDFTSNHGSPSHTCIYRLRVHGREPDSVSVKAVNGHEPSSLPGSISMKALQR
ncbi:hypothetical protein Tsubulata_028760 [Turnera subulata]|uniref:SUN domain-containing protein n=1 Tax=Turnera subulata TaxID=218843 RepID=A0A9Q0FPC1_9ROSI|nr:hypothetical protein Tsubulata_028760 [Turnera subulata]